jgi:hypothetical protein
MSDFVVLGVFWQDVVGENFVETETSFVEFVCRVWARECNLFPRGKRYR